jgi:hypothetical protein
VPGLLHGQLPISIPDGIRPTKFALESNSDHVEEGAEDIMGAAMGGPER